MVKYFGDFAYDYIYTASRMSEDQPPSSTTSEASPEGNLGGRGRPTTNNILLEYGEADLEEHFLNNLPRVSPAKSSASGRTCRKFLRRYTVYKVG